MPYVEAENKILTKVIGVASKIEDLDEMTIRQVVLEEMETNPESVQMIYLKQRQVWVAFENGKNFHLGDVRAKYDALIMSCPTKIKSWNVTGGNSIPANTIMIAGHATPVGHKITAKRGLNINISLL